MLSQRQVKVDRLNKKYDVLMARNGENESLGPVEVRVEFHEVRVQLLVRRLCSYDSEYEFKSFNVVFTVVIPKFVYVCSTACLLADKKFLLWH